MKHFSIILFLVLLISSKGFSCLCYNVAFPLKYLEQNDTLPLNKHHYIIKGVVIKNDIGDYVYNRFGHGNLANIKVLEFWPNNETVNDTVTIINDEACAVNFIMDSVYLIGAYKANRYFVTSSCEGTGLFSIFTDDVVKLNRGGIPKTDTQYWENRKISFSNNSFYKISNTYLLIGLLLSIVLNLFLIISILRKR